MTATRRGYAVGYLQEIRYGPEIRSYMEQIESTFEPYEGEWVVHGADPEIVEGELPGDIVIIGFPSIDAARDWFDSAEYQAIADLRTRNSDSSVVLLEGVPGDYRAAETIAKVFA